MAASVVEETRGVRCVPLSPTEVPLFRHANPRRPDKIQHKNADNEIDLKKILNVFLVLSVLSVLFFLQHVISDSLKILSAIEGQHQFLITLLP